MAIQANWFFIDYGGEINLFSRRLFGVALCILMNSDLLGVCLSLIGRAGTTVGIHMMNI